MYFRSRKKPCPVPICTLNFYSARSRIHLNSIRLYSAPSSFSTFHTRHISEQEWSPPRRGRRFRTSRMRRSTQLVERIYEVSISAHTISKCIFRRGNSASVRYSRAGMPNVVLLQSAVFAVSVSVTFRIFGSLFIVFRHFSQFCVTFGFTLFPTMHAPD